MENTHWISNYDLLSDISKKCFPYEETEKVPPLDKRFTYCLDESLLVLIQSYLKLYLNEADKIVDLTYHKFTINDVEQNQQEWIEELIEICDQLLNWDFLERYNEDYKKGLHYFFQILEVIMPSLWW